MPNESASLLFLLILNTPGSAELALEGMRGASEANFLK